MCSSAISTPDPGLSAPSDDPNPFIAYRRLFHAWHAALAAGWSDADYVAMVERLDAAVAAVDGHGFSVTPFARNGPLSAALGLSDAGGAWVKDETGNVSGSHKARHLFGTLLELGGRGGGATGSAPLAIASCGNAALAAAVVARAADRRLLVFIPTDADAAVVARLRSLGAELTVCDREPGVAGDPTYLRLLDAIDARGRAIHLPGQPQRLRGRGRRNPWPRAGGAVGRADGPARIDRVVIQVGGGALASSVIAGFANAGMAGIAVDRPRFDTVQTRGAFPLARAYERVAARVSSGEPIDAALAFAARHRADFMWPWEETPHSVAHGILDDETYDWRAVVAGMLSSGGTPLVVDEATLHAANDLARSSTGIDVDHTGSSGLAGLLHLARSGALKPDENVVVLLSGITRHHELEDSGS